MRSAVVPPKPASVSQRIGPVIEKEVAGAELPLALARFAKARGVAQPTAAMRIATHELLERVVTAPARNAPISVQALCRACNVTLKGAEGVSSRRDRQWAAYSRRTSHTGEISFDGDSASIRVPPRLGFSTARLSIAHELGHFLIHSASANKVTTRLSTSADEEALAEYGGRLMLMPSSKFNADPSANLAAVALSWSQIARTTLHSAVERLGDPDVGLKSIRGAILWRVASDAIQSTGISDRLAPRWHLCESAFVPIGKCKARRESVIANAANEGSTVTASAIEHVRIGTFEGVFRVDVVSWGSLSEGTRIVLSTFSQIDSEQAACRVTRYEVRGSEQLALM